MKTTGQMKIEIPEQLRDVVRVGVKANREVPGSVALGGTVCSLFTHHRLSSDIDFVLTDLSKRFEEVREHLLQLPDWKESRVHVPVLILGSLEGFEIGYRQMRRATPIETQIIETPDGPLIIPTVEELLRTKAFLTYNRNYTRDFVDFAELSCLFETSDVVDILSDLDERFRWEKQPTVLVEVIKKLLSPEPHDLEDTRYGFSQLRLLNPRLKSWDQVAERCREIGKELSVKILIKEKNETP